MIKFIFIVRIQNLFRFIEKIGHFIIHSIESFGNYFLLFLKTVRYLFHKKFPWKNLLIQIQKVGFESMALVGFTSLFMGMVFAFSTGVYLDSKLKGFGAYTGATIALAFLRELGPMLTALLVSGRSGSAAAAEIGTMVVNEQIDAIVAMGIPPEQYILLPRIVGGLLVMPILVFISDFMGILGGSFIAMAYLGQSMQTYYTNALTMVEYSQVFLGFIKALCFGFLILFVSSARGFFVKGGSEAVGQATTEAVVISSIVCVMADYLITSLLNM